MELKYDPETNILFDGKAVSPWDRAIEEPHLRLPAPWPGIGRSLRAARAQFVEASAGHPSGYLLSSVDKSLALRETPSLRAQDRIVIYSPKDHSWLGSHECLVYSRMPIEAFRSGPRWQQFAATSQLIAGIRDGRYEFSTQLRVITHARFVQPFLDMVLIFLGLPFVLETQRRHLFSSAAKSLLVAGAFSIIVVVCRAMGVQGIVSPALSAWLPLAILAPAAVLLSEPLHR
jgi:hypothetical protein